MNRIIITILFLVGLSFKLDAQEAVAIKMGDAVPNQQKIKLYGTKDSIQLAQFKGKLVILDFFSVLCVPCVLAIPKMEALQQKFKDKIQIIIVTSNTSKAISEAIKRSDILKAATLPIIADDPFLRKYFPHQSVPTHVWIDGNGIARFVTNGENTTEKTIASFLKDEELNFTSVQTKFKRGVSLWDQAEQSQLENAPYVSMVTKYIVGGGGGRTLTNYPGTKISTGFRCMNMLPAYMLRDAFNTQERFSNPNRVVFDLDSSKYNFPKENRNAWAKEHAYCYEIKVPLRRADSLRSYVKQDLYRNFGLYGKIMNRPTKCLVLTVVDKSKLKTGGGKRSVTFKTDRSSDFVYTNVSMSDFFQLGIGNVNSGIKLPVLNETGFEGNIDITINGQLKDVSNVQKELLKYGLKLEEAERVIPILVISDK